MNPSASAGRRLARLVVQAVNLHACLQFLGIDGVWIGLAILLQVVVAAGLRQRIELHASRQQALLLRVVDGGHHVGVGSAHLDQRANDMA